MKPIVGFFVLLFALFAFVLVWTDPANVARRETAQRYEALRESDRLQAERAERERQEEKREWQQQVDAYAVPIGRIVVTATLTSLIVALPVLGVAGAVLFFRRRNALVYPDHAGRLPVELHHIEYQRIAAATLAAFHDTQRTLAATSYAVPTHLHYAPSLEYEQTSPAGAGALPNEPAAHLADATLPGITDLATIPHTPTMQAILLGLGAGGQPVTVPMRQLWHIGMAGATGTGKSNIARVIIPQLLYLGAKVSIADPKFTPYDAESDEDWQPIVDRLHLAPAATADAITDLLHWHIDELDRRLELRRKGQKAGSPLFLSLDEWHVIEEDIKDAEAMVSRLSRIGRGLGIFLLTSAHSMLMKDGAKFRDQFRTGYYLGGARSTGSVLLDMPQREIDESRFETGIAYLRSSATSPAQIVRVPYASNDAIRGLLTDNQPTMERTSVKESVINQSSDSHRAADDYSASQSQIVSTPEQARMVSLFLGGMDASAVVTELTGMTNKSGKPYMRKLTEVQAVIREAMRQGVQR